QCRGGTRTNRFSSSRISLISPSLVIAGHTSTGCRGKRQWHIRKKRRPATMGGTRTNRFSSSRISLISPSLVIA
ncbi:hypothetical protein AK812_SmicGene47705, partial [Symbiodinium microadriaticum]